MLAVFSGYITVLLFIIGFISFNRFKAYDKQIKEHIETIKSNMSTEIKKVEDKQQEEFSSFKNDYKFRMSELNYFEFTLQGTIAMVQSNSQNAILAIRWMLSAMNLVFEKITSKDEFFQKEIDSKQLNRLFNYLDNYIKELSKYNSNQWKEAENKIETSIFDKIDVYFNDLVTYSFSFNNEQYKNKAMNLMNKYQDIINVLKKNDEKIIREELKEELRKERVRQSSKEKNK